MDNKSSSLYIALAMRYAGIAARGSVPGQRARLLHTARSKNPYTHTNMKLHLPKNLRSALLSAALAVFAATPSFAAITPWAIENWNGYDSESQSVTVGHNANETNVVDVDIMGQPWNSNWSIVFSADAPSLKKEDSTLADLTLLGLKWNNTNDGQIYVVDGATTSDGSLNLTTWQGASVDGSFELPQQGNITFVLSHDNSTKRLSLTAYNSADLDGPDPVSLCDLLSAQGANLNHGNNLKGVVFGGLGIRTTGSGGHVHFADDAAVGSYDITKVGYSLGSIATATDLIAFNDILTWDGGGGNNWSDASWSKNGETGQTCTASDSVYFAKDGANVTIDTTASVAAATIGKDTTFNLSNSSELTVTNLTLEGGKTLTLDGGGKLIVNTLGTYVGGSAGTVHAENGTSVKLVGTKIANTTVEGNLILEGRASVTLSGTVTLDSVDNGLTGGSVAFASGTSAVTLTFTGESDLTNGGRNNNSRISLNGDSSITVASGASLTTSAIYKDYNFTVATNASLTVEAEGSLVLAGGISHPNTCVKSLVNHGDINSSSVWLGTYGSVTNTGTLGAAQLRIYHNGNLESSLGGTVTVGTLYLERGIATVTKGGKLTVNDLIQGGTIDATASDSPVIFKGATITSTTIKGKLKLKGRERITLSGTVVLGSVDNELENSAGGYAFISHSNTVNLTFTGTSDLTQKGSNAHSKIGLGGTSTLIIGAGAKLTTDAIYNSSGDANANTHVASNGSLTVNGELTLTGTSSTASNNDASKFKSLVNNGTIEAENSKIRVYTSATTNEGSSLKAKELMIINYGTSTSSSLGGKVEVEKLTLEGGTTNISGTVMADSVSTVGTTAKTLGGTGGTLTLGSETDSTSTANVTLTGSFGIKKTGTSTQVLSGDTSGYSGKLTVSGGTLKVTNGIGNSAASAEVSGSGVLAITDTITATAKSGQVGTAKNVTINAGGITGATSGGGELSGLTLDFVAASTSAEISNVTMRDVTLKATATPGGTVTYANAKATVATVGEKESAAPTLDVATLSDTPATLTAMAVQHGGTASGTLTIDLTGKLLNEYSGRTLEWKFLDQVTLGAGFKVVLGDILAGMVSDGLPGNGLPEVWLTVGDGESTKLGTADISNITTAGGGLLAGTSGPVDVVLTVKNIPEPTTATLSLLALAALAARRRRK